MKSQPQKIWHSTLFRILLIWILGFTAYSFSLGGDFRSLDDNTLIVENERIRDVSQAPNLFWNSFFGDTTYYRPVILLSYMLEYHFFNLNSFFYMLDNLLFHLLNATLVFFIIQLILKDSPKAFFVALLYAIHPVQWEAVSNIAGRAIVLCAVFYFVSFLSYLKSIERNRRRYYLTSLVFYFFALLCKESAITLLAVIFAYEILTQRQGSLWKDFCRASLRILPFAAIAAAYMGIRQILGITEIVHWLSWQDAMLGLLTFLRGCLTFLRLYFLPVDLYFDRARYYFSNFQNEELWLTVVFYVLFVLIFIWRRKHLSPATKFLLLWPIIDLLPVSQLFYPVRAQFNMAALGEHHLYIPSVGILAVLVTGIGGALEQWKERKWISPAIVKAAVGGVCAFFFLMTIKQTLYASHEFAMLEQSLEHNPNSSRVRNSYALVLSKHYRFDEAAEQYRKAVEIDPSNIAARIGLGVTYCNQGKFWDCADEYDKVIHAGELESLLRKNKGIVYSVLMRKYREVVFKEPLNPAAHYSLGVVYSRFQKFDESIESYRQALALDPTHKNALFNIASSYEMKGDSENAIRNFELMFTLNAPKDTLDLYAAQHLVNLYRNQNDEPKAQFYQETVKGLEQVVEESGQGVRNIQIKTQ